MKSPIVLFGDNFLTWLVVFAQIIFVAMIYVYFFERKNPNSKIFALISKHSILIAFLASLSATLGSLFYSDVANYEPCKFCWFQRIFMYPQVLLLGMALWKKDLKIWQYSISLSIIGGLLSLNHYILQTTDSSILPCSAVGYSVSCSKVFVMHLGYITIPLMALSAFLVMIICMMFVRHTDKNDSSN